MLLWAGRRRRAARLTHPKSSRVDLTFAGTSTFVQDTVTTGKIVRTESISRLVFGWARSALDPKCTTHMTSQKKVCVMRANYIRGGCVTILLSDHVTICPRVFRLPQYDSWILRCKRQTDLLQPVYEGAVYSCLTYACVPSCI